MENIYIQWHFTAHGIAYMKHILSAFYSEKCSLKQKKIQAYELSQPELNDVMDKDYKNAFLFDKIYYFIADTDVFNQLVTYNILKRLKFYEDDDVLIEKMLHNEWREVIDKHLPLHDEYRYIQSHYPDKADEMWSLIWRNIQHYPVEQQIWWLKTHTNFKRFYNDRFEVIDMTKEENIDNLRDYKKISSGMQNQLRKIFKKHPDANFVVTPILTSHEVQVVWFALANAGFLPPTTRFISTYDRKDKYPQKRFKLFDIIEIPTNIVAQIRDNIHFFDAPKSAARKIAEAKMQTYINSGFAILLLGERGIGKTHLAERYKSENQSFVSVNCASFTNNTIAESILFGYKKGAFTDAKEDRKGVFEQAHNGILFLDEIHHLSREVQAKLMKAIETDRNNFFTIKRLGDSVERKVKATLIFASNRSIEQLREVLLPDFYDRITQLVIEIPPLREAKDDLPKAFEQIWEQMRFNEFYNFKSTVKQDKELFKWIRTLKLYGNYRDLQKIAIYYKTFLDFDKTTVKLLQVKTPADFARQQFEKYISFVENKDELFDFDIHPKELVKKYQKMLAEKLLAHFGSAKKIVEYYGKITDRTIYDWKNGK